MVDHKQLFLKLTELVQTNQERTYRYNRLVNHRRLAVAVAQLIHAEDDAAFMKALSAVTHAMQTFRNPKGGNVRDNYDSLLKLSTKVQSLEAACAQLIEHGPVELRGRYVELARACGIVNTFLTRRVGAIAAVISNSCYQNSNTEMPEHQPRRVRHA